MKSSIVDILLCAAAFVIGAALPPAITAALAAFALGVVAGLGLALILGV